MIGFPPTLLRSCSTISAFTHVWLEASHDFNASLCHPDARPELVEGKVGIQYNQSVRHYFVYILSSQRNGTLYIGVTNNLLRRVWEHKHQLVEGFTNRYEDHHLVYFEQHENAESVILRERQLKEWRRNWKLELIEKMKPDWKDLYKEL